MGCRLSNEAACEAAHFTSYQSGDERTRSCVNHSVALLLIELAHQL